MADEKFDADKYAKQHQQKKVEREKITPQQMESLSSSGLTVETKEQKEARKKQEKEQKLAKQAKKQEKKIAQQTDKADPQKPKAPKNRITASLKATVNKKRQALAEKLESRNNSVAKTVGRIIKPIEKSR